MLNFLTLAGLYAVNFLLVMTAVLLPVDTLSGEIASGVIQTVAAKPIRRSDIVLGKWLGHWLVMAGYLALLAGGVLAIARVFGHFTPPHVARGLPLMLLEGTVLLTLSVAGGTRLSTVTNGILAFGLYGLAFIGSWVEQIGTLAAFNMQPPIMRELAATPFSPASVPSAAMVVWAAAYAAVALAIGVRAFTKRAL